MKKVILTKGLPASGKTTWAKELIRENPGVYKRVNKDDLRLMLDCGKWSRDNEKTVLKIRDQIILAALNDGKHVIVDDTNLHEKHEKHIRELVKGLAEVETKEFDITLKECIERDLKRRNSVGKDVIEGMYKQFIEVLPEKIEQNLSLPSAVIVDVDGTLAKMDGRGPYDWDKVETDLPNERIVSLVKLLANASDIIIVTGRDGSCADRTERWLKKQGIEYSEFYIRPEGNTEKDYVIKRRFLDDVTQRYHIDLVLDDRDQVVKMWRELGLTCLQVNYGNF